MINTTTIQYENQMPQNFVQLSSIDPTIIQSVRYASSDNFLGRVVEGYEAATIILTETAALALQQVQQYMQANGYSLVVYDGYRPQRAVEDFYRWSQDPLDCLKQDEYYPTIEKANAFALGYISRKSAHTRGSTVDLSIIELGKQLQPIEVSQRILPNGDAVAFLDDGTIDMGTSFDLFHEASSHGSDLVDDAAKLMREFLRDAMIAHGFDDYRKEWWHYSLLDEPYKDTFFDFPISI